MINYKFIFGLTVRFVMEKFGSGKKVQNTGQPTPPRAPHVETSW
jgi:hypothetical protein